MFDRIDALVAMLFIICTAAGIGILADEWRLVYYAMPLLATLLMVMGSLSQRDRWSRAVFSAICVFGAVFTVLLVISDVMLTSDAYLGGLPASTAIVIYMVWPVTVIVGSSLYTWAYQVWLRHDNEEVEAEDVEEVINHPVHSE